jgi:hypothetical protein
LLSAGNRGRRGILKPWRSTGRRRTTGRRRSGTGTGKHGAALSHGSGEVDVLDRDHRLAESHGIADTQLCRSGHPLATGQEGTVRRTEILEHQLPGLKTDLGMSTGDLWIQKGDVTDISTDDDRLFIEGFGFGGTARVLNVQGVERHRVS